MTTSTKLGDNALLDTALSILLQTTNLVNKLSEKSITTPASLEVGASSGLWTAHDPELESARSAVLGLTQKLDMLLHGPHGFLHEYVSTNWEHGALYTLLEFHILDKIPLPDAHVDNSGKSASVTAEQLAVGTGLTTEKLLRVCRLAACVGILKETSEGSFAHTAISEELVRDKGFRAWVEFQLYETRVASANLADSLKRPDTNPNNFWTGQPAFDYAWGKPMYTWHREHPEKGKRFAQAMQSVAQSLDPGNPLMIDYLSNHTANVKGNPRALVVDVAGKNGAFAKDLASHLPQTHFEVLDPNQPAHQNGNSVSSDPSERLTFRQVADPLSPPSTTDEVAHLYGNSKWNQIVFLVRGTLWNLNDEQVVSALRGYVPVLTTLQREQGVKVSVIVSDLVSPDWGTFEPHVERAYRRRDVTLMTMHNVKQRTRGDWEGLVREAFQASGVEGFKIAYSDVRYSSHSSRGLWAVELE